MDIIAAILTVIKRRPWLLPPLIIIGCVALIVGLAGNPAVAPFLYTLF